MDLMLLKMLFWKMVYATLVGSIIGLEREIRGKDAGLKTFVLISCGSAMFASMSLLLGSTDPARIAAQIVTGVGFLGAGVIWKGSDGISGITTAAFIWVVAALGTLVGIGLVKESLVLTVGMLFSITIIAVIEKLIRKVVS